MNLESLLLPPTYVAPVETRAARFPKSKITVACVWVRPRYTIEDVLRLRGMIRRNLDHPHEFVCFTDHTEATYRLKEEGIRPIIVEPRWPGWWQKIRVFNPGHFENDATIFYCDLDVVISQNLNDFFCVEDRMVAIANFGVNYKHSKYNSSVMLWENGFPEKVYTLFRELGPDRVMKKLHGDQCWIWRVLRDSIAVWPRDWVRSYKYDVRKGGPVPPVTVFHGSPKPSDVKDPFVKEHFRP